MTKDRMAVADVPLLSVTWKSRHGVGPIGSQFAADGVPLISPVPAFRPKPAGKEVPHGLYGGLVPRVQVYGGAPPVALRVAEYGTPTIPYGRLVVVMVGPPEPPPG